MTLSLAQVSALSAHHSDLLAAFTSGAVIERKVKVPKKDENGVVIVGEHEIVAQKIGRGLLEPQLFDMGYLKSELKRFEKMGLLRKTTVPHKKGWRNVWVLLDFNPERTF